MAVMKLDPASNAIQLFTSAQELSEITSPASREKLAYTLSTLDATLLTEEEIRNCFAGIRVAMAAFITKVNILENSLVQLKKDQEAAEARMEAMHLQARNEIRELRLELKDLRSSTKQPKQILQIAKLLHGNLFVDIVVPTQQNSKVAKLNTEKLPSDFTTRLEFAQQNGFKWNQNNRPPTKSTKQLQLLEEWEDQFCLAEKLTIKDILDRSYVAGLGPGAVAGALMVLERELNYKLPERKTISMFNCYQRAIKLYNQRNSPKALATSKELDIKRFVSASFNYLTDKEMEDVEKRFKTRVLGTVEQAISAVKKVVSKSLLPSFIEWREEDGSDTEKLYSLQSGEYDTQLRNFLQNYYTAL